MEQIYARERLIKSLSVIKIHSSLIVNMLIRFFLPLPSSLPFFFYSMERLLQFVCNGGVVARFAEASLVSPAPSAPGDSGRRGSFLKLEAETFFSAAFSPPVSLKERRETRRS